MSFPGSTMPSNVTLSRASALRDVHGSPRSCTSEPGLEATVTAVAKKVFIKDHIDHCLDVATEDSRAARRAAVEECKQITEYL